MSDTVGRAAVFFLLFWFCGGSARQRFNTHDTHAQRTHAKSASSIGALPHSASSDSNVEPRVVQKCWFSVPRNRVVSPGIDPAIWTSAIAIDLHTHTLQFTTVSARECVNERVSDDTVCQSISVLAIIINRKSRADKRVPHANTQRVDTHTHMRMYLQTKSRECTAHTRTHTHKSQLFPSIRECEHCAC